MRWQEYARLSQVGVLAVGLSGGRAFQAEWKDQGLEKVIFGMFVEKALDWYDGLNMPIILNQDR